MVVGGGYGGVAVAKALDDVAHVTLVEPRATFVHNVAALRAVVEPEWAEKIFIPYDGLLAHGTVRRDRAVRVAEGEVELASGAVLAADYVVLATGSSYPFPAKIDDGGPERLHELRAALAGAGSVLLAGAGPVGVELAGEIKATWPAKRVILADRSAELLPGTFPGEFREQLRDQLDEMGVDLRLGAPVDGPGDADLWIRCYGAGPDTGYLTAGTRAGDGRIEVTPTLRVRGTETLFAVGDVTAVPERKMAYVAGLHAEVVAANIRSLIAGEPAERVHEPQPDAMILTLGPKGGVTFFPGAEVMGASATAGLKAGFRYDEYRELLGAGPEAHQ